MNKCIASALRVAEIIRQIDRLHADYCAEEIGHTHKNQISETLNDAISAVIDADRICNIAVNQANAD